MLRTGKPEGFAGQVIHVVPTELRTSANSVPALHDFHITDIGRYPNAYRHYYSRTNGAGQHILIVCELGSGWIDADGERIGLQAGQFVVIPQGKPHSYGASQKDPWTISWCHFVGAQSHVFSHELPINHAPFSIDFSLTPWITELFKMAFDVVKRGYSLRHLAAASSLVHAILSLVTYGNKSANAHSSQALADRHLEQAVSYIVDHISQPISLDDIARHVGLSASRLSQLFRTIVGHSPIGYVTRERIYRACHYLTATDLSIARIAENVGYEDPFYFSRVFKRVMGIPPRAYRNMKHEIPTGQDDSKGPASQDSVTLEDTNPSE